MIFQRNHRGGDGNVAADLLGIIIANGVAVGILAHTVNGTGHVEQALCQSGLAASAVTQQADVANGVDSVHSRKNSFRDGVPCRHPNRDIIHEGKVDFNAYFRQNAKLCILS